MKANCYTCKHDLPPPKGIMGHACAKLEEDPELRDVRVWVERTPLDSDSQMPPIDADGCPGYESAAPLLGRAEDYTAQHVPTLPYDRTGAPIRIETEADIIEQPSVPWDPDEDGRNVG